MGVAFSIVVPTFDRPRRLADCLAAIARIDYPRDEFEVIVVDDGSREPVEPPRLDLSVRVERQPNRGPAAARNRGVAAARGRWIAFTDDDCRPAPDWLRALEPHLAAGAAAVAGQAVNALPRNPYARASQDLIDHLLGWYNRDPADATFGTSNDMAVDRATLVAADGFDDTFSRAAGEDRELLHRLHAMGHRIVYEPRARVDHLHDLGPRSFWRQHYSYGRAAALFGRRSGRVRVEPPSFYRGLLSSPDPRISALLLVAQVANAAGYARESIDPSRLMTVAAHVPAFLRLPPSVALFYARACRQAVAHRDWWTLGAAAKPRELRALIAAARGRRRVVEIGTGTAWSTVALALADPQRTVLSFDPRARPERELYLALGGPDARERIELVPERAEAAASTADDEPVGLLFMDGSHKAPGVIAEFEAWRPRLAPGAIVAIHDWGNPRWPGVREATETLGLDGRAVGELYLWRVPAG